MKNLVKFFAIKKVRINAIAPGFIDTQWQLEKPDHIRNRISEKIALKHFGSPTNVTNLIMHVIDNTYINGSIISIDGGYNFE